MTNDQQTLADMVAMYFATRPKTPERLRFVVTALAVALPDFRNMTADELEHVARHNEAAQGVHFPGLSEQ